MRLRVGVVIEWVRMATSDLAAAMNWRPRKERYLKSGVILRGSELFGLVDDDQPSTLSTVFETTILALFPGPGPGDCPEPCDFVPMFELILRLRFVKL